MERSVRQPWMNFAIAVAVSTIRFEKPHSLSYQLTTRTSFPSITAVSRLSTVDEQVRTAFVPGKIAADLGHRGIPVDTLDQRDLTPPLAAGLHIAAKITVQAGLDGDLDRIDDLHRSFRAGVPRDAGDRAPPPQGRGRPLPVRVERSRDTICHARRLLDCARSERKRGWINRKLR